MEISRHILAQAIRQGILDQKRLLDRDDRLEESFPWLEIWKDTLVALERGEELKITG